MAREGDKWRVVRGDCLWNIAKSVYGNPYKWTSIADANGVSRSTALIYPNQLLTLPGITPGTNGGGAATPPPAPPAQKKVNVQWWALDAGTDRDMFCAWSFNRNHTEGYNIEIWQDMGAGGWRRKTEGTTNIPQYVVTADANAKKVLFKIKPYSAKNGENYYWTDGEWVEVTYDFSNNPPLTPSTPNVELDENRLKCSLDNIDENINGDTIEFVIYKNNTTKYQTGTGKINKETRHVAYECTLEPGGSYTVRCRAIRGGSIYSNWSDYTDAIITVPISPKEIIQLRPQVVSEQGSKQYGVFIEWTSVATAKNYEIQYTTNITYFDTPGGQVSSITTEENQGNKYLISNIELGHEYFFRVRSINDTGTSGWTGVKSTTLGTRPAAPTTWSNTSNCIVGEDLNLYWTHNSTDGSLESIARLNIIAIDSTHPDLAPMEFTKVIRNIKPEEEKDQTSIYKINTTDKEWSFLQQGFIIKWKVQTAGVVEEYSEWSIEREVNVYAKPELEIDIINNNNQSVSEISSFPFYIKVNAKPAAQIPISYYLEVIANQGYETIDSTGKLKIVNVGDKIYQKFYDPTENPWEFLAEMTPGNIDLQNGINYTINCTVSMNSSLTATNTANFDVFWTESFYEVGANILLNRDTLEANINPYCNEFYIDETTGETLPKLTENCILSVYRREYDGSYTLIASDIVNATDTYVTDPHPSLDYVRYRVTATSKDTGSISFADIDGVKFGEPSVVIQWSEEWSSFETDDEGNGKEEPLWSGSLIKIPYNVDVAEKAEIDSELIEYVGRKHPVAYYGTHQNESATWNVEIPREDTNMIYALRRLAKWAGDVYVREPSGIGYWATITVNFNLKHKTVTVPVTFNIKRVEGGI